MDARLNLAGSPVGGKVVKYIVSADKVVSDSSLPAATQELVKLIFEVEQWLPRAPCGVWEVHPEVSFALLMGEPAKATKEVVGGMLERRHALVAAGIQLDQLGGPAAARVGCRRHARRGGGGVDRQSIAWRRGTLLPRSA